MGPLRICRGIDIDDAELVAAFDKERSNISGTASFMGRQLNLVFNLTEKKKASKLLVWRHRQLNWRPCWHADWACGLMDNWVAS